MLTASPVSLIRPIRTRVEHLSPGHGRARSTGPRMMQAAEASPGDTHGVHSAGRSAAAGSPSASSAMFMSTPALGSPTLTAVRRDGDLLQRRDRSVASGTVGSAGLNVTLSSGGSSLSAHMRRQDQRRAARQREQKRVRSPPKPPGPGAPYVEVLHYVEQIDIDPRIEQRRLREREEQYHVPTLGELEAPAPPYQGALDPHATRYYRRQSPERAVHLVRRALLERQHEYRHRTTASPTRRAFQPVADPLLQAAAVLSTPPRRSGSLGRSSASDSLRQSRGSFSSDAQAAPDPVQDFSWERVGAPVLEVLDVLTSLRWRTGRPERVLNAVSNGAGTAEAVTELEVDAARVSSVAVQASVPGADQTGDTAGAVTPTRGTVRSEASLPSMPAAPSSAPERPGSAV